MALETSDPVDKVIKPVPMTYPAMSRVMGSRGGSGREQDALRVFRKEGIGQNFLQIIQKKITSALTNPVNLFGFGQIKKHIAGA